MEDSKSCFTLSKLKIYRVKNKKSYKKVKKIGKERKSHLKTIKNRINQMLKIAKFKGFFDFLPQSFICNISKQKNKPVINMTFKELMSQKFYEDKERRIIIIK